MTTAADLPRDGEGTVYHVGTRPGDVAPFVLLCGDPERAEKVAQRFDTVELERRSREYVTYTGSWRGGRVTVTATGIGTDNTEIAVVELLQCVDAPPTFIRVGSSGALQDHLGLGDLIVSTGSVRLESTSTWFVPEGFPALAHHEAVLALIESASGGAAPYHVGLTATACGFYGAQGREVPGFRTRFPDIAGEMSAVGVLNYEMEASLLFSLAALRGMRAGAVCAVYANRGGGTFVDRQLKQRAEAACIDCGLGAVEVLRRMDAARGEERCWRPGLGLGEA